MGYRLDRSKVTSSEKGLIDSLGKKELRYGVRESVRHTSDDQFAASILGLHMKISGLFCTITSISNILKDENFAKRVGLVSRSKKF